MPVVTKKSPKTARPPRKGVRRAFLEDLSLFVSLSFARFIVWRVLRVRRKERAARLKGLRVINGGGQVSVDNQCLPTDGMDDRGMSREATRNVFLRRGSLPAR